MEDLFAVLAGFRYELALLLDLQLVFMFLQVYEVLFPFKMFRHAFLPGFKPAAHLSRLATHRFRLESAPGCLLDDALFLHIDNFIARLLGFPKIGLVVAGLSWLTLTRCTMPFIHVSRCLLY